MKNKSMQLKILKVPQKAGGLATGPLYRLFQADGTEILNVVSIEKMHPSATTPHPVDGLHYVRLEICYSDVVQVSRPPRKTATKREKSRTQVAQKPGS